MSNTNTIHELQQQITFQEQILDSLNTSVTKQQIQLTKMERSIELLAKQIKDMRHDISHSSENMAADSKPPHY